MCLSLLPRQPLRFSLYHTHTIFHHSLDSHVKINYSPYLIDIVLFGEIDSLKHKAVVKGQSLILITHSPFSFTYTFPGTDLHIILYKKETGLWGALEVDVNDKNELKILKNEAAIQQEEIEKKLNENRYDKVNSFAHLLDSLLTYSTV